MAKVTRESVNKKHQKHAKLTKPLLGEWGRNELALLGTPCSVIKTFAETIIGRLSPKWKVGFVDADHKADNEIGAIENIAVHFTDKISYSRLDYKEEPSLYTRHLLFNACDLILINGNHFKASKQIIFIDPRKLLESKVEELTDVRLVVLKDEQTIVPDYLKHIVGNAPIVSLDEQERIGQFFNAHMQQQIADINGLVLTGGKSTRMGTDKSLINYHGIAQRDYVYQLLRPVCREVYVSCNREQAAGITIAYIEDRFLGIGPMGGLLSAFQSDPNRTWLTVACDIPYLSASTLDYLVAHRDPSKVATAFIDEEGKFPEPLITIWEPKAYPILLQALAEGYSCPRKVLINSDIKLLHAPNVAELENVNDPASYERVRERFSTPAPQLSME